jgi:hypothetical protein
VLYSKPSGGNAKELGQTEIERKDFFESYFPARPPERIVCWFEADGPLLKFSMAREPMA